MVRVSTSQSVDLRFSLLVESYRKTLKMVSIASLLGARHLWEVVDEVIIVCFAFNFVQVAISLL